MSRKVSSIVAMLLVLVLLCTGVTVLPVGASAPDDGLLLYYTFDDGNVTDSSGNNLDGVGYGTLKEVPGVSGNAMYFSGGYVQLPELDFSDKTALTISVWTCALGDEKYARISSFGSSSNDSIDLLGNYNGGQYGSVYVVNGTSTLNNSSVLYTKGAWTHLVLTYSDDGKLLTLYQNGAQVAVKTVSGAQLSNLGLATNNLLGRCQKTGIGEYLGYVDEYRLYDRVLTQDEIQALFRDGQSALVQSVMDHFSLAEENGLSNLDAVLQDLTLPTASDAVASDAVLSYSSDNAAVLDNDGKIGDVIEPTAVNLTVTATRNGTSASVVVPVTVVPKGQRVADPVEVVTTLGAAPELPDRISANDGSASVTVTWNTPETSAYAAMYALAGTFTVEGITEENETVTATVTVDDTLFTNPVVQAPSCDPFITYLDGWYYYVKSNSGVCVAKARRLQDLGSAPLVKVITASDDSFKEFWAPELHYVDGCWYIYAAPIEVSTNRRRMFAFKASVPDDPQSPFEFAAEMGPTVYHEETDTWDLNSDTTQNRYALDGTVLEVGEKKYFIYSAHTGTGSQPTTQRLYINEMADATTLMGDRVLLPAGGAAFEKRQSNIGNSICEGPQILVKNGKVFVFYSTDQSNYNWYQECLLYADVDSDLLDPNSWTKYPGPVLTKSDDPADRSLATGHACVIPSPDGTEEWMIYHAYETSDSNHGGSQEGRYARALKISWGADGLPVLGNPVPLETVMEQPSGTVDQLAVKFEAESAVLSGGATVKENISHASGGKVVTNISGEAGVTFTVQLPKSGRYLISFSATGSFNGAINQVTINGTESYRLINRISVLSGMYRFMPSYVADAQQVGTGLYVELEAGENTIQVTDTDDTGTVDIDYLYMLLDEDPTYTVSLDTHADGATMEPGESVQLTASVTPNDRSSATAVTWSSSDDKVATVNADGLVTAVAAGEAVITAALPGGAAATYTVTVSDPAPAETAYLGDLNRDDQLSVTDVVLLRKAILANTPDALVRQLGDLSGDAQLSVTDVVVLRKAILAGGPWTEITLLPTEER